MIAGVLLKQNHLLYIAGSVQVSLSRLTMTRVKRWCFQSKVPSLYPSGVQNFRPNIKKSFHATHFKLTTRILITGIQSLDCASQVDANGRRGEVLL